MPVEISADWGEAVDPSKVEGPVVYHFRPTSYVKVAPDKLQAWEQYFAENTGLVPDQKQAETMMRPGGYLTVSASGDCWDDCDYV
ncbi:MAG: hypothetical protein ABR511_00985 [Acidimicrobiales bacterium]